MTENAPYMQLSQNTATPKEAPSRDSAVSGDFFAPEQTFSRRHLLIDQLPEKFTWNDKLCSGSRIHKAVLENNVDEVREILESGEGLVDERFRYETENIHGGKQEGSGEAIHIAASRGHARIIELLFEFHASVDAWVTRGHLPHYQVLQGAIFAEGKGGNPQIVGRLLEARAALTPNQNGQHPLHLAFQVGNLELIKMLRHERKHRGMEELEDVPPSYNHKTPLEEGILMSGMSRNELVEAAPLAPISLHIFSRYDPNCIPRWLQRFKTLQVGEADDDDFAYADVLASQVICEELIQVLVTSPLAADAILRSTTSKPKVGNRGLHPLPPKICFKPAGTMLWLFGRLNPPMKVLPTYQREKTWAYDGENFKAPDWHSMYVNPATVMKVHHHQQKGVKQVDFIVSHIPDLASAEFFIGIAQATRTGGEEALMLFENPVVEGLIHHVWWESVCETEVMHHVLNIWGLLLLMYEQYLLIAHHWENEEGSTAQETARLLKAAGGGNGGKLSDGIFGLGHYSMPGEFLIATEFMIARGVFMVWREVMQMVGSFCVSNSSTRDRFHPSMEMLKAAILLMLYFDFHSWPSMHLAMRVGAIAIHWGSLLNLQDCSEFMASALLPLINLFYGLVPCLALTLIGICCCMHVRLHMMIAYQTPFRIMVDSFLTLFTSTMPEADVFNAVDTSVNLICIVTFTLFFLNIFIGVIGELYQSEQASVHLRYRQLLCQRCLKYMLRYRSMPKRFMSRHIAAVLAVVAVIIPLVVQMKSLVDGVRVPYALSIFSVCMVLLDFASFSRQHHPWVEASSELQNQTGHHLWIAQVRPPIQAEDIDRSEVENLQERIKELKKENDVLRRDLELDDEPVQTNSSYAPTSSIRSVAVGTRRSGRPARSATGRVDSK